MRPADNIEKLIENTQIQTDPEVNQAVLNDLMDQMDRAEGVQKNANQKNIWRIIMKSKTAQFTAAAVILIALLVGINQFQGSSIAFADVIQPILDARTVVMDIFIGTDEQQAEMHDEVMGTRIRRTVSGVTGSDIIIDLEQMKMLALTHAEKTAVYVELDGLDHMKNYLEMLQDIVARMQDKTEYNVENQGLQNIDGQDFIIFVAENDQETITILVDPETELPVRIEQKTPNMKIACDNMQFDVDLDASRFSMEIPEGYVVQQTGIDYEQGTEEAFVESLRIWAEIIEGGYFPDSIDLGELVKNIPKIDQSFKRANLTKQEEMELAMRWGQGLVFLRFFKGQGQWHYNGKGVEFGDGDTPIFWYQPQDSETWRVIYGDLRVEDVAAEDLPE